MKGMSKDESIRMCACGRPLHYTNVESRAYVERMVQRLGEHVLVTMPTESYLVPRHYIALHGIKATELSTLAEKYGWEQIGVK